MFSNFNRKSTLWGGSLHSHQLRFPRPTPLDLFLSKNHISFSGFSEYFSKICINRNVDSSPLVQVTSYPTWSVEAKMGRRAGENAVKFDVAFEVFS